MKIETPILKRLGPVPFWRGERKCLDVLESMYTRSRRAAEKILADDSISLEEDLSEFEKEGGK